MKKLVVLVCLLALLAGCAADQAVIDHRAAVMCGLADKINAGTADDLRANAPDVAWTIENERRAAVNLSNWAHWQAPCYQHPALRPTSLPWVPTSDPNGSN